VALIPKRKAKEQPEIGLLRAGELSSSYVYFKVQK
jgi:hypothetical protein